MDILLMFLRVSPFLGLKNYHVFCSVDRCHDKDNDFTAIRARFPKCIEGEGPPKLILAPQVAAKTLA